MAHLLARLRNVKIADVKIILKRDAGLHAKEGLYLEHVWQNADDPNEVLFLFRSDDLSTARKFIRSAHSKALKENPSANLPLMTFLMAENKISK